MSADLSEQLSTLQGQQQQWRAEKARRSLAAFTEYLNPEEPPAKHHLLLIDKLEAIERGELKRLMVFMPPGSAKSTYCSVNFPAWFMGRNGRKNIIAASFSGDLAKRFGRKVRNIVDGPEYQEIFNSGLAKDSAARGEWETSEGGEYFAAGVDGAINGRRGDGALIDDPVKGRRAADSELERRVTWDWYSADIRPRLKPGAFIVIIMTRWHEDDLAGRILPKDWDGETGPITAADGEEWYVLCLPAEARENDPVGRKVGEILWPEYLGPVLEQHKRSQDARGWNSLYQQTPTPDEGTYFKREWFNFYDDLPKPLNYYGTSDYAVTDGGGDFTEHPVWGISPELDIYLVDGWYGQTDSAVWVDELLNLIARYDPITWVGEAGQIRRSVEPFLKKRMQERNVYCRMEWLASIGDKAARARAFQARASMGKVYLPNTEYGHRALEQLLKFPAGKYDDFVDAATLIGRGLDELFGARLPASESEKPKMDMWDKAWAEQDREEYNWKTA